MTVQEMHLAFKIGLDKIDSLNYPNILPEEIDFFLNKAQERFVKQRYGFTNVKKQSFEETEKRTNDLRALVKNSLITATTTQPLGTLLPYDPLTNIDVNAQFVELPNDYWFMVQERANLSYLNCNNVVTTDSVYVKASQHDDYSRLIDNPFEKPLETKVLRFMAEGKAELIHAPGTTVTGYNLRYIKKPLPIVLVPNVNTYCELSEHAHSEIVDQAVMIALEGIESKRLQTFIPAIQNTQE